MRARRGVRRRPILFGLLLALGALALTVPTSGSAATPAFTPPAVKHVWVIELENKSYDAAFVQNSNTYLFKTLPSQGVLLRQYYGIGHFSLDNYIAELSGQAPNPVTQSDCQRYQDFVPGTASAAGGGQFVGQGCVYPKAVKTLPDQLDEKGLSWRGYMQDMGFDPAREEALCGRPVQNGQPVDPSSNGGLGAADGTQSAAANDQYAVRHNPFLYFHSAIDDLARCKSHVVPLEAQTKGAAAGAPSLTSDLALGANAPAFNFITPNLCDDAHDATCVGPNTGGGKQGGLFAADLFLKKYVPMIQNSAAYADGGMIIVTLDESGDTGTQQGAEACCGEPTGPNTPLPGQVGPGGGRIGTVVLSPFTTPGTVSDVPYNHYSFLRSMEDAFRLGATAAIPGSDGKGHLGYAGMDGLVPFGPDVYSASAVAPAASGSPAASTSPSASASPCPSSSPNSGGGNAIPSLLPASSPSASASASSTASAAPSGSASPCPSSTGTGSPGPSSGSPTGSPSAGATPSASSSATTGRFHPLTPQRVFDTRKAPRTPVTAGADQSVQVTGMGGVPTSGVSAVVLNVTATGGSARGDLQVYPTGQKPANRTSNQNYVRGQASPVQVQLGVGDGGKVNVSVNTGSAQVIVDVCGYYGDGSDSAGDGYTALQPQRLLDTRSKGQSPVRSGTDKQVQVTGNAGVPAGATAVTFNATLLGTPANADLQVFPTGNRPTMRTSNLNVSRGLTKANAVTTPLGTDGKVSLSISQNRADVVLDVIGYYNPSSSGRFIPLTPQRIFDSRSTDKPAITTDRQAMVRGKGGVPDSATAAVLSVTATGAGQSLDLQVAPTGNRPAGRTSTLNVRPAEAIANLDPATLGNDGSVTLSLSRSQAQVILDVVGYFTGS